MTEHFFSGRQPESIHPLKIRGVCVDSPIVVPGIPVNIYSHYAINERALGTTAVEIERWLYENEIKEWSKHDIGLQTSDCRWEQFIRWKRATEEHRALDVVPIAEEIGYKESSRERAVLGNHFVHDSEVDVSLNKIGFYVSKTENARQDVNNHLSNGYLIVDEAEFFNKFMKSKDYSLMRDIDWFAVGHKDLPENAIAGVHKIDFSFIYSKDFRNMIAGQAKIHGVDYEDEKFNTLLHELIHLYGVDSEEALENLALEFYLTLANREDKGFSIENQRSSRSSYEEYKSKSRIPASRLLAQGKTPSVTIDTLIEQSYAEAKEMGLSKEDTEQYINACLEIYEKAGEESYKEAAKEEVASKEALTEEAAEEAAECAEADGGGEAPE